MVSIGILFALGALLSWGFGDFFIQRATRVVGVWKSLFFITLSASVILFPFIYKEIPELFERPELLLLLVLDSMVSLFAALCIFRSFKEGKIAVVEPLMGMELPIIVGLSIVLWNEALSFSQALLILAVFIGIVLTVTVNYKYLYLHKQLFEKGAVWAGLGAIGMGLSTFIFGIASQLTSPLMANWFVDAFIMVVCFLYLWSRGQRRQLVHDFDNNRALILSASIVSISAWIFYAYAVTYIPISIATTISESYIALAVLLGLVINKEKLQLHQLVGVVMVIASVIILSAITV